MRPVVKKRPGDIVQSPVVGFHLISQDYSDYKKAKAPLVANIGQFCSYCEAPVLYADIEVEHVLPKGKNPQLETKWDNFLLGCGPCNGSANKGEKEPYSHLCHLPHINNTFLSLRYMEAGVVTVNPILTGLSRTKAETLWRLVGLDKSPEDETPADKRCSTRRQIWTIASRYLYKYLRGKADTDTVIDLAKSYGHWSIWFTVFKGCDDVLKQLIEQFPGTAADCFDAANHYEPLPRNAGSLDIV